MENVVLIGQGQAPLAIKTVRAAVMGDRRLQSIALVVLDRLLNVRGGPGSGVFNANVVA